ncbi:HupE/UreJ family protein [Zhongshania aquimaris]|uniref:HupE/UreJ family protein n=1 Tax=Zhongshania aquimaris TaxID=2857107 RepID=A0ABS6VVS1_9GAMM|nr:HupE/UreJ family protein [Zhongshania aquimaris]
MKFLIITMMLLSLSPGAWADDARPAYFSIVEKQALVYMLKWRIPPTISASNLPTLALPADCSHFPDTVSSERVLIQTLQGQRLYQCQQSLSGGDIQISYPVFNPSLSSLVKYNALSGESYTRMLAPNEYSWTIPETESAYQVALDYTRLGIQHIWEGIDHLLFLLCLVWIAGSFSRILITVTGFTLSHSFTLALSALDLVHLPVPPVEAVIALSIVFLATEIAKSKRDSLTWNYPVAVSTAFGLLHGLGFAAVLTEIGLPQVELVTGLLFFNVGVEVGQLVFVTIVALVMWLVRRMAVTNSFASPKYHDLARVCFSYTIGVFATYWMVERCMQFV